MGLCIGKKKKGTFEYDITPKSQSLLTLRPPSLSQTLKEDQDKRISNYLKQLYGKTWLTGILTIHGDITDDLSSLKVLPSFIKLGWGINETGEYYYTFYLQVPAAVTFLRTLQKYPKLCRLQRQTNCEVYRVLGQPEPTAAFVMTQEDNNPDQLKFALNEFMRHRLRRYLKNTKTDINQFNPYSSREEYDLQMKNGKIAIHPDPAIERQYNLILGIS